MSAFHVIANPLSGGGRAVQVAREVAADLGDAGATVRITFSPGIEAADGLVKDTAAAGETCVVVGGDGMVHLAVQALAGTSTRLGLIPAGTGNDVARYLDIPRKEPNAAVDIVLGGRERVIDLARVGAKYFVTVLAAGFDAKVNERANQMTWPKGQMRYNLATLAELRTFTPIPYVLDVDGEQHRFEAMMVAVGNGPSFGGGLRITEGARLDDGLLDVVAIMPMSKTNLVRTYPKLFSGAHVHHPNYRHFAARSVTVAAPDIVAYADGERFGALPLTVEIVPLALRVLAP